MIWTRVPGNMSILLSANPFISRFQIQISGQWAAACVVQFAWLLQTFYWTQHPQSQNSQPCVCMSHRKIQGIMKLLKPWSNFQICFTKMIRRTCTSQRCLRFSRARFHAQGQAVWFLSAQISKKRLVPLPVMISFIIDPKSEYFMIELGSIVS